MGIGTLRRYHDDARVVGETPLPEGAVDATREEAAAVADATASLAANDAANEAAARLGHVVANPNSTDEEVAAAYAAYAELVRNQASAAAEESHDEQPDTPQTTEVRGDPAGEESKGDVEPTVTVKEAGDTRSQGDATPQEGQEPPEAGETPAGGSENPEGEQGASTAHGDIERPGATASTDAWIDYAKADPKGEPFDLAKRPGLRDDIAAHYSAA